LLAAAFGHTGAYPAGQPDRRWNFLFSSGLLPTRFEEWCMGRCVPIRLEPTKLDLVVARAVARRATPAVERPLRAATWAADEKVLLVVTAALWVASRTAYVGRVRQGADHLLACAAASAVLPHLFKQLVDRERPDRVVVRGARHGIPRSGNA
jgi:hypothetical protein